MDIFPGYFSLERQASCDSVSSVNSSASNATFNSLGQNRLSTQSSVVSQYPNFDHRSPTDERIIQVPEPSKIKKKNWVRIDKSGLSMRLNLIDVYILQLRTSFRRAFGKNTRNKRNKLNETSPVTSNWESDSIKSQQHYRSCHSLHRRPVMETCKEHRSFIKDRYANRDIK